MDMSLLDYHHVWNAAAAEIRIVPYKYCASTVRVLHTDKTSLPAAVEYITLVSVTISHKSLYRRALLAYCSYSSIHASTIHKFQQEKKKQVALYESDIL